MWPGTELRENPHMLPSHAPPGPTQKALVKMGDGRAADTEGTLPDILGEAFGGNSLRS